jgi:hypothetical protein
MPFIEEYIKQQQNPPVKEGLSMEVEYSIGPLKVAGHCERYSVTQRRVGTVFIGTLAECTLYVRQQRAKQALKLAEQELKSPKPLFNWRQGLNPDFVR